LCTKYSTKASGGWTSWGDYSAPPDPVAGLSGNGGEGRKGCGRKRKRGEIKESGGKRGERTLSPHFRFSGFARAVV